MPLTIWQFMPIKVYSIGFACSKDKHDTPYEPVIL